MGRWTLDPAPWTLLLALVGAAGVVAGQSPQAPASPTGTIHGRVRVMSAGMTDHPGRSPSVAELGAGPREQLDRRREVVYLEVAPRPAFDELRPGRARMDQRNEQFVPRVLAITVGATVDFPNNDITFHNVFSLSRTRVFDLGRYPAGQRKSVRFDQPGIVRVFCEIHSHMSAHILVFSHPYFAVTDDEGRYGIAGVPPGAYTLTVWSERARGESRKLTVGEGGSVEADFQIGREP